MHRVLSILFLISGAMQYFDIVDLVSVPQLKNSQEVPLDGLTFSLKMCTFSAEYISHFIFWQAKLLGG